ncbi:hypothetical protein BH11MYX1_BH11MYX1_03750 [soil metagenome]
MESAVTSNPGIPMGPSWRAAACTRCLDDLEAFALVGGTLAPERLPEVLVHVESCADCHALIEGLCLEAPASDRTGDPLIGTEIGGAYQIAALLAVGGMGRVYRARDLVRGREVALNLPRTTSRWIVRRFAREVAVTARLGHPGIVAVYDSGKLPDGTPFYVMPLFEGVSLELALTRATNRDQRLALLGHVIAIANTMAYAHERQIAHRDLKPHNVLVGRFGETVILDWGPAKELGAPLRPPALAEATAPVTYAPIEIAQLLAGKTTRPGDVLGTPAFMPPEQARGEDVDQRADVYALGAILEQLLVGRLPRKAADAALAHAPPPLVAICRRAMSPSREDRHPDGAAFARELRAAIDQPAPVAAVVAARRWPATVGAVGVIKGVLVALSRWL